jgi:hypothetical protein
MGSVIAVIQSLPDYQSYGTLLYIFIYIEECIMSELMKEFFLYSNVKELQSAIHRLPLRDT